MDKLDFFNLHDVDLSAVIKIQAWGGVWLLALLDEIHNKVVEINGGITNSFSRSRTRVTTLS